jgi:general stress protein YciG
MHLESGDRENAQKPSAKRGFAAMSKERQREISSMGGRAAHAQGKAHVFTSEEARLAGKKGGASVSRNRAHMAAIGRKGGENSRLNKPGENP